MVDVSVDSRTLDVSEHKFTVIEWGFFSVHVLLACYNPTSTFYLNVLWTPSYRLSYMSIFYRLSVYSHDVCILDRIPQDCPTYPVR